MLYSGAIQHLRMLYSIEYSMCYVSQYIGCYIAPLDFNSRQFHHCKNCYIAGGVIKRGVIYSIKYYISCYIQVLYSTIACYIALNLACAIYHSIEDAIQHHWLSIRGRSITSTFGCSNLPLTCPCDASESLQSLCQRRSWLPSATKLQVKAANLVKIHHETSWHSIYHSS